MKTIKAQRFASPTAMMVLVLSLCSIFSTNALAQPYVELGLADSVAFDQPRVTVEIYTPDPEHSFGPEYGNYWLLDTGAQGMLSAAYATSEMKDLGYTTEGTYNETGIGGTTAYDVSAVYNFDFAGSDGLRNTLSDVRIMSSDSADFGGFGGIVGMPAMVNRVTSLDLTPLAQWEYINVAFGASVPTSNGHRYHVPLTLVDFPAQGDEPLPTYAPLPFVNAKLSQTTNTQTGSMVLDTGAQMSLMSSAIAFALGLDANGNGDLTDEAVETMPFVGAGGTYEAPIMLIDRLALPTEEGIDIVWTNVYLAVVDIDPAIGGVIGSDLLTSGYMDGFTAGEEGYIEQIHFDFTEAANFTGTMVLDLNPDVDIVTLPEPATLTLLLPAALSLLRRRKH